MSKKNKSSLRNVPRQVFEHYANMDTLREGPFSVDGADHFVSVAVAKKTEHESSKPYTLVCLDHAKRYGGYQAELRVYDYLAKLEEYDAHYDRFIENKNPRMKIWFRLNIHESQRKGLWKKGIGYWVEESLVAETPGWQVLTTPDSTDPEFAFFTRLQLFALKLAKEILVRGHWEYEWNPEGKYMKKPGGSW